MIRSVADGTVRIGDKEYRDTIAITTDEVMENWPDKALAELTVEDFGALLQNEVTIVVLGTGSTNVFAPRDLIFAFARLGVGLEVMDSQAAARTFNVLAGEGRRVAAVLY
jgi:uncharacterized protein